MMTSFLSTEHFNNDDESRTYEQARIYHAQSFESSSRRDLSLDYPRISAEEVTRGKILGQGGFAEVYEIKGLDIRNDPTLLKQSSSFSSGESQSRSFLSQNCIRDDQESRYALKTLICKAGDKNINQALSDLVTEARILAEVRHPNIIKLLAVSSGERFQKDFFIVVDKLHDPLDKRIERWRLDYKRLKGLSGRLYDWTGKKRAFLFLDRLETAYHLGSALEYLHRKRIVYRDLKPENVAFDMHGDLKLFDFGLAKVLPEICPNRDGLYKLTGKTGTLRYQAPEVALGLPYNKSCDVYSFAILLWEMLSMKRAFELYSAEDIKGMVFVAPYKRPQRSKKWHVTLRDQMHRAWSPRIRDRPIMNDLVNMLEDQRTKCPAYKEKIKMNDESHHSDFIYNPTTRMFYQNPKARHSDTDSSSYLLDQ